MYKGALQGKKFFPFISFCGVSHCSLFTQKGIQRWLLTGNHEILFYKQDENISLPNCLYSTFNFRFIINSVN